MYVSLNWLKDFVDIDPKTNPQELGDLLTLKTAEVEGVVSEKEAYENMVTGRVEKLEAHPDADKLKVAQTNIGGGEVVQIVCGGANLEDGMHVAVTKVGSKVRWHGEGELIELKKTKIRGVESHGMIAAACEIGVDDPDAGEHDIMDLNEWKPEPGTPLSEFFKRDDVIFEFDNKSLTHRPDLWGHYGIAREVAAITGKKFKKLKPQVSFPEKGESVKVEIKDFDLCPRYCGLIIDGIKVEQSPDWLKARLKATDHGTHNNIVDITNYVMTELGQPLHAFDKNFIKGGIIVRRAEKKEKITTLDDKERELSDEMLVIADHEKPVAVAGVMGGQNSEIKSETTAIIIESANFNASSIRKTSTKLGLRSDAVQRFEKSLDPVLAELAIKRATELILQVCPEAKVVGPITDVKDFDDSPVIVDLDPDKARSKIGIEISDQDIQKILESLHFVVDSNASPWKVTVPSFRATKDVGIEDDLIEEVARIYGYDNIPAEFPHLPAMLPEENTERFKKHRLRELLSYGLGFSETYNYSFYSKDDIASSLMTEDAHLKVLNYLSEDQTHMRTSLIPNLLKTLHNNYHNFPEIKVYEVGRTYKEIGEFMPLEEKCVAGAILRKTGKNAEATDGPFYEAKGVVETILRKFQIKKVRTANEIDQAPYAHPTKSLSFIDKNAQTIAKVFTLHPVVQKNADLENAEIAIFELNFTELNKLATEERKYRPIPKFPAIEIDVSVIIDRENEVGKIRSAILQSDQNLIAETELFDIYQGENLPDDKKSVAFKVTLLAEDRTLTDEEMAQTQQKIFTALEKMGGEIRKG